MTNYRRFRIYLKQQFFPADIGNNADSREIFKPPLSSHLPKNFCILRLLNKCSRGADISKARAFLAEKGIYLIEGAVDLRTYIIWIKAYAMFVYGCCA